ncbi:MAG TPA: hypothetical protein VIK72_03230 [Clostridiaceae bacterium]
MGSVFKGFYNSKKELLFPGISYMNNAANCLVAAKKEDNNFSLLLKNGYGTGTVYTLTVLDDFAEVQALPIEVLTVI